MGFRWVWARALKWIPKSKPPEPILPPGVVGAVKGLGRRPPPPVSAQRSMALDVDVHLENIEVAPYSPREGDVVIFRAEEGLSIAMTDQIREQLVDALSPARIVIIGPELTLETIVTEESWAKIVTAIEEI